ncbi:MAG: hypothetical protein J6386_14505 [Candidatus Synoicihabitans palmerolidicus]|nr:hypothetical protein [Candidatus Synoicihabitans palmerolidicus]
MDDLLADKTKARTMGKNGLVSERYDFDQYLANLESLFSRISTEHALPA